MRRLLTLCLAASLLACGPAVPESIDAAHLVGRWELRTSSETEWVDLAPGGGFTGEIRGNGFIAATLSQGPRATLRGTWMLADHTLTLTVADSSDPALAGRTHVYRVVSLSDRAMVTESADGTRQTLARGP